MTHKNPCISDSKTKHWRYLNQYGPFNIVYLFFSVSSSKELRINWWLLAGKNSGMWNIGRFWYSYKWFSNTQEQKKNLLQTEHVLFSHVFSSPSLQCLLFSHNVSKKNIKDLSYKEQFHRYFKEEQNFWSPHIQSSTFIFATFNLLQIPLVLKVGVQYQLICRFLLADHLTSKAEGRFRSDINLLFPLFKTFY